jgi:dihydrofolate reductase
VRTVRPLIESTFVTLGGDIGAPQEWGPAYLNCEDGGQLNHELLFQADALLLGRQTYEGLSAAYTAMTTDKPGPMADFVARMNAIPKYVASTTLPDVGWNSTLLEGDIVQRIIELKREPGRGLLKYGTGPLDRTLLAHGLIDELHL